MGTAVNFKYIIDEELVQMITSYFNLNLGRIDINALIKGMLVELEHGTTNLLTNITHNNLVMTYKLALSHLLIHEHYYDALEMMSEILKLNQLEQFKNFLKKLKEQLTETSHNQSNQITKN